MSASWKIVDMQRDAATGLVTVCHWTCSDVDGEFSGSVYGSVGLTGELETPYEDLTEEQVLQWVFDAMGEETVAAHEANVAGQIAAAKEPVTAQGVPWL